MTIWLLAPSFLHFLVDLYSKRGKSPPPSNKVLAILVDSFLPCTPPFLENISSPLNRWRYGAPGSQHPATTGCTSLLFGFIWNVSFSNGTYQLSLRRLRAIFFWFAESVCRLPIALRTLLDSALFLKIFPPPPPFSHQDRDGA